MNRSLLIGVGILLLFLWIAGFVVFKVAGFLIHVVLIIAAVLLIMGLVRRVRA
ncbi:MAG: DUF5670 family protein [Gemmatimonadota bacterium]|nr:DUF5670 family protein [Gemmatimonadota bacterium]